MAALCVRPDAILVAVGNVVICRGVLLNSVNEPFPNLPRFRPHAQIFPSEVSAKLD
jgi:hypothetical protein